MQQRINDPRTYNLRPDIMLLLQDELLAVNPYARQYHNMGHVLQRERQIATANNQPVRPVKMIIAKSHSKTGDMPIQQLQRLQQCMLEMMAPHQIQQIEILRCMLHNLMLPTQSRSRPHPLMQTQ